jgi:hypothetical protein
MRFFLEDLEACVKEMMPDVRHHFWNRERSHQLGHQMTGLARSDASAKKPTAAGA